MRPCILTPSEYSFWEKPIFVQFIITSKQIVGSFYFFFSGEADSLCEHFEPSHTVFNDSEFMLWRHQTSSHPPRWNFATGAEVTNPKNADICKRRRVKGFGNYFNRKGNQFYIIWYILNYHYLKVIINILYFTAPAELNQNIKYCKSQ